MHSEWLRSLRVDGEGREGVGEFLCGASLSDRAVCSQLEAVFGDLKRLIRWSFPHQDGGVVGVVVEGVEGGIGSWRFGMGFGVGSSVGEGGIGVESERGRQ